MITDYLIELLGELELPPHRRRRILAEVEDHLSCSAADLHAAGLDAVASEREAVTRFGPAAQLARALIEQEAAHAGKRAARASALLAALLAVALGPAHRLFPWTDSVFPTSFTAFVLVQVAVVAGALSLVRAWRPGLTGRPRGARLALVCRGAVVVVCCVAVTVLIGAADALNSSSRSATAWLALAGLAAGVAGTCATLVRSRRLARGPAGTRGLAADPGGSPTIGGHEADPAGLVADPLSDLHAGAMLVLARLQRRLPFGRGVVSAAERGLRTLPARLAARAPRLCSWLHPTRHPWRFAIAVSSAAGLALATAHGVAEGVSTHHPLAPVFAGGLIATIEALSALAGFAVLGRFLGLRPRRVPADQR